METIAISLTKKQQKLMAHLFVKNNKEIGMILGQFSDATDGTAFFIAKYIDVEQGVQLQKAMGVKPGEIVSPICEVYK